MGCAVGLEAGAVLGRLLGHVRVQRAVVLSGPGATVAAEPGSTARTLWIAAQSARPPRHEAAHALGPRFRVAVSAAGPRSAALDAAMQVARVERRDPDAGLLGGVDERAPHGVRVRVGRSAGAVMEVVELADGALTPASAIS